MTDGDRPQPPPRPPQPTGRVGNRIAGLFLILFAILLILAGGGCTIALFMMGGTSSDAIPLILISLAILAGGLAAMWFGVRLMSGRYD
jgi:TRAP-type C4-dicarboxylate transport system permease small subunit